MALKIEGKTLSLITVASVKAGNTDAARFEIVKGDKDFLMAVFISEGSIPSMSSISSLVLNKKNGLAVWTKSRAEFLAYDAPDTQGIYLACR